MPYMTPRGSPLVPHPVVLSPPRPSIDLPAQLVHQSPGLMGHFASKSHEEQNSLFALDNLELNENGSSGTAYGAESKRSRHSEQISKLQVSILVIYTALSLSL